MALLVAALLALLGAAGACANPSPTPRKEASTREEGEPVVQRKSIEAVLSEHNDRLLELPGVVGTAIGECAGAPCIKVLVAQRTPALAKTIPDSLGGYPVAVEETGEIRALDSG